MASWEELFGLIRQSLSSNPAVQDANEISGRFESVIRTFVGDDVPIAYHLTAQSAPDSEPITLDIAVVSSKRVYSFSLLPDNNLSASSVGIRNVTSVNIRGAGSVTVVRLLSGGDVVLTFADIHDREESLIKFAATVVRLTWP